MSLMELFNQGGFIMYPLFIFSILTWTVAVHKYIYLMSFNKQSNKINEELIHAIAAKTVPEFRPAFTNLSGTIANPYLAILDNDSASKEEVVSKMYRTIIETNADLKDNLWMLGTIASSAPFVGLFGTVLGIMGSFKAIGESGKSGFSVVATGISESLIATAAGIVVAVIAVIFYNFLQTRVNKSALKFKHRLEDVAELISKSKKG